jgi:hypothetical protein
MPEIRNTLSTYQLDPVSIRVLHPLGDAISIVASTNDPARTLGEFGALRDALFGNPPKFDGYYFEIRDAGGSTLLAASAAFRSGVGRFWTRPDVSNEVQGELTLGRPNHLTR